MVTFGIKLAIEQITREIETYESNTFSASGSKLTRAEASALTAYFIQDRVQPGINLDGCSLSDALDEIRDK